MSRKNSYKQFVGKSKDRKPLNYREIFGDDKKGEVNKKNATTEANMERR